VYSQRVGPLSSRELTHFLTALRAATFTGAAASLDSKTATAAFRYSPTKLEGQNLANSLAAMKDRPWRNGAAVQRGQRLVSGLASRTHSQGSLIKPGRILVKSSSTSIGAGRLASFSSSIASVTASQSIAARHASRGLHQSSWLTRFCCSKRFDLLQGRSPELS
jgi:hypothetical protein